MRMSRRSLLAALTAIGAAGCLGGGGGGTDSPTPTDSPTATASATATDSPTPTESPTPTATQRSTPTATDRPTPSPTATDSPTPTATATPKRRQTTWTHPETGHEITVAVTGSFAPVTVQDIRVFLQGGYIWTQLTLRAQERLEQVAAQATASGDLPTDVFGDPTIDYQQTRYKSGVLAGQSVHISPRVESHPGVERIEIVLDDRETGPNSTPTDTATPCDGIWCS